MTVQGKHRAGAHVLQLKLMVEENSSQIVCFVNNGEEPT